MKRSVLLVACALACTPSLARADDVVLKNGGTIENIRAAHEAGGWRLSRAHGSTVIPDDEVLRIVYGPTVYEELARKKLEAGFDPAALRDLARWCEDRSLRAERDDLLALARGIELDRKLEALEGEKSARPFLELALAMKTDGSSADERRVVLEKALARGARERRGPARARAGRARRALGESR